MEKLPDPAPTSNHFKFLFLKTSFGNNANISLIKLNGVFTSPYKYLFSLFISKCSSISCISIFKIEILS